MDASRPFHPGDRRYYGPKDGRSRRPVLPRLSKVATRVVTSLVYKREVTGTENIPKEQGYVFSPNHENTFDPIIWRDKGPSDIRGMVTMDVFENPVTAFAARLGGGFPVDRFDPAPASLKHSVDVIKEGSNGIIYPQGGFRQDEQIGGIFKGASYAVLEGGGKGIVPVGIHIEETPKQKLGWKDGLLGGALAATVGLLAVAGAPLVAGALAGASAVAIASGKLGGKLVPQKQAHDPIPNITAKIAMSTVGSITGAVAGAVLAISAPVTLPLMAAAGVGGVALAHARRNRPVAKIAFQEVLPSSDYQNDSQGVRHLTKDLHESIAQAKSRLSGVPIDRSLPVFGDKPWQAPG